MRIAKTTRLLPLLVLLPATGAAQEPGDADIEIADPARAENLFRAHCGRCHGVQGLGGEGPELARLVLPRVADQGQLERVIRFGIPGTGMPGARSTVLDDDAVSLVATYVRWMGAQTAADGSEVAGDADTFATVAGKRVLERVDW